MKHIKTFEQFEQQEYTVGDIVKLSSGEAQYLGYRIVTNLNLELREIMTNVAIIKNQYNL